MRNKLILALSLMLLPTLAFAQSGSITDPSVVHSGADINSSNQVTGTHLLTPLPPAQGGVGAMSSAPFWLRGLGDGNEGALTCSGNLSGEHWVSSFTVTGTCTVNASIGAVIRSTGACTISGTITNNHPGASGTVGGGSGGGSGGGTSGGTPGGATNVINNQIVCAGGGSAGASSGGNGGPGNACASVQGAQQAVASAGNNGSGLGLSGANGKQGANSGGAAGNGAPGITLVCDSINFTGTVDMRGGDGGAASANNTGGGSAGGGGVALLSAKTWVANTGSILTAGGHGGDCSAPAVVLDSNDNGIGAFAHVSALSGGNPSTIAIDNGGSGYTTPPSCSIVGGGGSGATCTCTVSSGAVAICTPSGGNAAYTLTTYTVCGLGGYGGSGFGKTLSFQ